MADHDQRRGARSEVGLEPRQRVEIEVVGRLVEQQQVGARQQHPGHQRAHPPAAGEGAHRPREVGRREAEPGEHDLRPRLERVAARPLEERALLPVRVGQAVDALLLARRRGRDRDRLGQLVALAAEPPHVVGRHQRRLEDRRVGGQLGLDLLRQIGHAQAAAAVHRPLVRLVEAGHDSEERRLAAAVGTDEPVAVAGVDRPGDLAEERPARDGAAEAVERQHRREVTRNLPGIPPPPSAWFLSGAFLGYRPGDG